MSDTYSLHPVDEKLPVGRLATLGIQHVLVMYGGAVAVPLIVGRALQLSPQDVAFLISADLFVCGLVTIIQSLGVTRHVGIRLPVMMGVTFASVGPMVSMATMAPGPEGARMIFGAIIGAGFVALLLAPIMGRLLRFFPPVVTGTIILIIGVSLMRVGINWTFGNPFGPTAPKVIDPAHAAWLTQMKELAAGGGPAVPNGLTLAPTVSNPFYAEPIHIALSALVLVSILLIARYGRGLISNIAVLSGVIIGFGLIPLLAPNYLMWMPHAIHPIIESGIVLASIAAVVLNAFFNGVGYDNASAIDAARMADSH